MSANDGDGRERGDETREWPQTMIKNLEKESGLIWHSSWSEVERSDCRTDV